MIELFLLIIRWIHTVAAIGWVGGALFYWLIARPVLRSTDYSGSFSKLLSSEFRQLVSLSMWTLVITGLALSFDRLSSTAGTVEYFIVLAIKVLLVGWMFFIVQSKRLSHTSEVPRTGIRSIRNIWGHVNMILILGIIVIILSDVLRWIVELELS